MSPRDDIVWRVVRDDLPVLIGDLENIVARTHHPGSDAPALRTFLADSTPLSGCASCGADGVASDPAGSAPTSIERQRAEIVAEARFEL